MKTKKIGSKLILAKSTITNLDAREMGIINGGEHSDAISCGGVCIFLTAASCLGPCVPPGTA